MRRRIFDYANQLSTVTAQIVTTRTQKSPRFDLEKEQDWGNLLG